jgi:catecholate siderophore receptor
MSKDKKLGVAPSTLALAISGALMAGVATAEENITLDKVKVEESITPDTNPYAVPGAPYLAETLSDPRRTRSLAETPQTITVITETQSKNLALQIYVKY